MTVLLALVAACHSPQIDQQVDPRERANAPTPDLALEEQALRIAADYPSWQPLDQPLLRVAPTLCSMPPPGTTGGTMVESQAEGGPHGQKLYRLYARDPAAYRGVESGAPQAHQVLVKESFVADPYEMTGPGRVPDHVVRTTEGLRTPGARAGLFIMLRGSEDGDDESLWRYATVSPEGEVTAAGRIESCIRCHQAAPYGGLFGLDY